MLEKINLKNLKWSHQKRDLISSPVDIHETVYEGTPYSFLYESLESRGKRGRYSFVGGNPYLIFKSKHGITHIQFSGRKYSFTENPITLLRKLMKSFIYPPPVSPFPGGALGYAGYDAIRFIENIPDNNRSDLDTPDLFFIFPGEIIVFDHKENMIDIVSYDSQKSEQRINELNHTLEYLRNPSITHTIQEPIPSDPIRSNFTKKDFQSAVEKAKEYIYAGDIFQVVLSQRFCIPVKRSPWSVYKSLRKVNPSPYMYYLSFKDLNVLGSSPEILVKMNQNHAVSRPLAGTRPRGNTESEDNKLEIELLNDEKERAEHIMLVDLARNDLGRVCQPGSVQTTHLLEIERYSKVMHLVSHVQGQVRCDCESFDLFTAAFPAGTVSGAPKIRAMEIIDELEHERRGIYAGGIGYFAFSGDTDFCIAIRMIIMTHGLAYFQAGAGIVADSNPENEYKETFNKAEALIQAIQFGE
jgi:anthranilate synthase component 1